MPLNRLNNNVPVKALLKRFALIYLPIVIVLYIALLSSVRLDAQSRVEKIKGDENSRIAIAEGLVARDFSLVNSDLLILANSPLLRWYQDSGNPAQREELEKYLLALSQELRRYDQVRYLDASGQEVIRINYNDGKPAIVPHEQLQNKKGRYYFDDTLKLNRGEIFVSPLDLNIEHGSLEIPYKPTIRFGTPVFDSAGHKKGIILLNYFGDHLLQHYRKVMQGGDPHSAMLLNRDGYWLSGAKREDEWGFMLDKNELTFGHDFPEAWRAISASEQGTLLTDRGLFVYTTAYPLLLGQRSSTGSALAHAPSQHEVAAHEYYWKIVSFVPHAVLSGAAFYNQTNGRILLVIVYLVLALAAWVIASVTLNREQIKSKLQLLGDLVEQSSDGISIVDPATGRFLNANEALCHDLGYAREELLQRSVMDIQSNIRDEATWQAHAQALSAQGNALIEFETLRKDGSRFPAEVSLRYAVVANHAYILANVRNITERKQAEVMLHESEEKNRLLFESSRDALMTLAPPSWKFTGANQATLKLFGASSVAEFTALGPWDVSPGRQPDGRTSSEKAQEMIATTMREGSHFFEWEHRRLDGQPFAADVLLTRMKVGEDIFLQATVRDITERKQAEDELKRHAQIDLLTGLNNRRHFYDLAELELARAKRYDTPLSVLMLDVDHFKSVNDTYGHHAGDMVLRKLSEVCVKTLREIDILGRLGGEEFAILLPETKSEQALEVAERLRLAVAGAVVPFEQGGSIHFTVSIGVALYMATDARIDDILKRADTALYAAKNAGRNRVCGEGIG